MATTSRMASVLSLLPKSKISYCGRRRPPKEKVHENVQTPLPLPPPQKKGGTDEVRSGLGDHLTRQNLLNYLQPQLVTLNGLQGHGLQKAQGLRKPVDSYFMVYFYNSPNNAGYISEYATIFLLGLKAFT